MTKRTTGFVVGVAAAIALIAAAFLLHRPAMTTSSMSGMPANTANAVSTSKVDIQSFSFQPMVIRVRAGTTVSWTNHDTIRHNVVADKPDKAAPDGPLLGKGETYSFTFKKAGTYTYHCMPHPDMHGTVIVTN